MTSTSYTATEKQASPLKKILPQSKILANRYDVIKNLGQGTFGNVYLVTDLDVTDRKRSNQNQQYVVKEYRRITEKNTATLIEINTINALSANYRRYWTMHFPNDPVPLVEYVYSCAHGNHVYSISKYLGPEWVDGSKIKLVSDEFTNILATGVSENILDLIFKNMAKALGILYVMGYAHRDVKPENFMVNVKTGDVKLIDFGTACQVNYKGNEKILGNCLKPHMAGTLGFMHSGFLSNTELKHIESVDPWAYAVTVLRMASGSSDNTDKLIKALDDSPLAIVQECRRVLYENIQDITMADILKKVYHITLGEPVKNVYKPKYKTVDDISQCTSSFKTSRLKFQKTKSNFQK